MSILEYVNSYIGLGLIPCPVAAGGKRPLIKDWPNAQVTEMKAHFHEHPDCNIGVVLGRTSNNVVDVDLDDPVAVDLARLLLPSSGFVFGRRSNPDSHHFFSVDVSSKGVAFCHPVTGEMLIELRGDGQMTVVPGSTHPSGEKVEFARSPDAPSRGTWARLLRLCTLIAVGVVVADIWREGQRHKLAVALAGCLATSGVDENDATALVAALVKLKDDDEDYDRRCAVETTYARYREGAPVCGKGALEELLDPKVVQAISKWLGGSKASRENRTDNDYRSDRNGGFALTTMGTDVGAASAFAASMDGYLIYSDESKLWYLNSDGVFDPASQEQVVGLAVEYVKGLDHEGVNDSDRNTLRGLKGAPRIRAMVDIAKSSLLRRQDTFDAERMMAGCENGVLDLRRRRLSKPDGIVTKRLGTLFESGTQCPTFSNFLLEVFDGDEDVIRFIQRAVGYTLTGETSAQCLFLCIGTGSNGKSTLFGVLHALLGDYAATIPMHTLMQTRYGQEKTDDLATLIGMRFASAQEGEAGSRLAEAKIKMMTGGDPITCRQLYRNYETYSPQFKLWLATNDLPQITGTGEAIWRRIHVIPFPVTFSSDRKDPDLKKKLLDELPGILNWALEGVRMWTDRGLDPPAAIQKATGKYRGESDVVAQFVDTCCVRFPEAKTLIAPLYDAYKSWCSSSGFEPIANSQFGKELNRLGFDTYKTNTGMGRKGLTLMT